MKKIFLILSLYIPLSLFALIGTEEVKVESLYDIYRAKHIETLPSDETKITKLDQTQQLLDQYASRPTVSQNLRNQIDYLSHLFCHTRSLLAQELCNSDYRPTSLLTRSKATFTLDQLRTLLTTEHSRRRQERNMSKLTLSGSLNAIAQKYAEKLCEIGEITHTLN